MNHHTSDDNGDFTAGMNGKTRRKSNDRLGIMIQKQAGAHKNAPPPVFGVYVKSPFPVLCLDDVKQICEFDDDIPEVGFAEIVFL